VAATRACSVFGCDQVRGAQAIVAEDPQAKSVSSPRLGNISLMSLGQPADLVGCQPANSFPAWRAEAWRSAF
jgi:hypothetical protein